MKVKLLINLHEIPICNCGSLMDGVHIIHWAMADVWKVLDRRELYPGDVFLVEVEDD